MEGMDDVILPVFHIVFTDFKRTFHDYEHFVGRIAFSYEVFPPV
jgi:hypothetical protein